VSPVEYAGGECSLRAYIAVCLQIHCNPSSYNLVCSALWQYCWGSQMYRSCAQKIKR